ncbi:MAG: aspartate aminotransferase family protein [Ginsengibacter sp.]
MTNRQIFLNHIGQASPDPLALEILTAKGSILYDVNGKEYIDLIGGISVCNIGHGNQEVINAIKKQAEEYTHVMVNGEFILSPQTSYAKLLTDNLPTSLNCVFFTASGTEATEGAMKLAKRFTGRTQIAAFKNSYHGSTQGSLSIVGDEYWRNAFRPLLPDILHLEFNSFKSIDAITNRTACVIAETIQSEAGVNVPDKEWMQALRNKCNDTGTLMVLDEIQCGFGRNGTLWAFEQFGVVPDILLLGKALGGGMPMGAFIADKTIMDSFTGNPVLGHINTFGGHPVCCAAGKAAMEFLLAENIVEPVFEKERLFHQELDISNLKSIQSRGLMLALDFHIVEQTRAIIDKLIENGVLADRFLFSSLGLKLVPPLTISNEEIKTACKIINKVLSENIS